jgi:hypothetical protein
MKRLRLLAAATIGTLALIGASQAIGETAQKGNLRVSFSGALNPKQLPRHGTAPIAVRIGGRISTTDGGDPPGLERIEMAINRAGRFDPRALPACRLDQIQPASTSYARRVCGSARVGDGAFSASIAIPEQSPYPSQGTVTAFNGVVGGRPVILLHIYGAQPVPTSFTLPLEFRRGSGRFSVALRGDLPTVDTHVGFVTGISLQLDGGPAAGKHPYLSAGCPAPQGFGGALFPLARASFTFADGRALSSTLVRRCSARG